MTPASQKPPTSEGTNTPLLASSLKVRWGDMDALGHVNNTCYFRYCEQVRMEWFASLDLTRSNDPSSKIVIINAFCEFLVPVVYPCSIIAEMSGSKPGKSSFMSHYVIRDSASENTVYCNGTAKIVWVNAEGTKSVPLPDTVRALLEAD